MKKNYKFQSIKCDIEGVGGQKRRESNDVITF